MVNRFYKPSKMGKFYFRKVQELPNSYSYSLVIPKEFCENLGIQKGDYVKVELEGKGVMVTKVNNE